MPEVLGDRAEGGNVTMDEQRDFGAWYQAEHGRLVAVLLRLGADPGTAADVAAEAFSRVLERWSSVGVMASPSGWTYQVAFNLVRRRARRATLEAQFLRRQRTREQPAPGGEIWLAVRVLPPRQRMAVVLHYLVDLPYKDVAEAMGISEGTVAASLSAARRTLGQSLAEQPDNAAEGASRD
jgi:RNA polymerase sigma factor (sigma-70 family)